jgi:hypothetical protein
MNNIGYRHPNLINDEYWNHIESLDCQLFVFPTFLKSGKHYYIVDAQDWGENIYYGGFVSTYREEEVQ